MSETEAEAAFHAHYGESECEMRDARCARANYWKQITQEDEITSFVRGVALLHQVPGSRACCTSSELCEPIPRKLTRQDGSFVRKPVSHKVHCQDRIIPFVGIVKRARL